MIHCLIGTHARCMTIACSRCGEEFHDSAEEWPDIRSRGRGLGVALAWYCPTCVIAYPPEKWEVYHVRHSCGHSCYWENSQAAAMEKSHKCPWCGSDVGPAWPRDHPYFDFGPPYGRVTNNARMRGPGDPDVMVVHHYPDLSCCQGAEEGVVYRARA